jgi:hypothetical protein
VLVGVELLAFDGRVKSLHTVSLEGLHEDGLGHFETVVQVVEVLVAGLEFVRWNISEGAVEVVNAVHKVFCEALNGKVLRCLHFALSLVLEVAEIGNAVLKFILSRVLTIE